MTLSTMAYRSLLRLYPQHLRLTYGEDMVEAFAQDLAAARGRRLIVSLWWCAALEVITIALPERLASPVLKTRAASVAAHIAIVGGMLALMAVRNSLPPTDWHGLVKLDLRPSFPHTADGRR